MNPKIFRVGLCAALLVMACVAIVASQESSVTERILHTFTGGSDGADPASGLTLDSAGNFYGSTFFGGSSGNGVVYKLTRSATGTTQTVIHTFAGGTQDGANPEGSLALGPNGVIYGTTISGGNGDGVIYSLTPSGTTYTESILYVFSNQNPAGAGVILDKAGNLYGTASGGAQNDGTVYELKRTSTGYKYVLLYSFTSGDDGDDPFGGVVMDSQGNLYGTTASGGPNFLGDVFELKKNANGTWTERILYTFQNTADGVNPESALVFDSSGNLYGTTVYGGDTSCAQGYGCGEVFELMPSGNGVWNKTTLYAFTGSPDGHAPTAGVTFDSAGNIFGTTSNGGTKNTGALYELSPSSSGWTEKVVYSFLNRNDGGYPSTPVIFDAHGNLFGTAGNGGKYGFGVVFGFPGLGAQ